MESPFPSDEERASDRKAHKIVADIMGAFIANGVYFAYDGCRNCEDLEYCIRCLDERIISLERSVRVYGKAHYNISNLLGSLCQSFFKKDEEMPSDVLDWAKCHSDLCGNEE